MTENKTIATLNILKDPVSFVVRRIPNWDEVAINFVNKATMDTFLGRFSLMFGDNPTAASIYRDALRVKVAYSLNGTQISSTGIYHDEGGMYASTAKTICKGTILYSYKFIPIIENLDFESLARSGNYICEAPARFLNIVSRERQLAKNSSSDISIKTYGKFLWEDSKTSWVFESIGSGGFKTFTSDQVGEVVKNIGYVNYIREINSATENIIIKSLGGDAKEIFLSKDDIYTKCYKAALMFDFNMLESRPYIVCAVVIMIDWTGNALNDALNSEILITSTKTVQDFAGTIIKDITNLFDENSVTLLGADQFAN
jgi:hypothetical protein